jgi:hypothetical protein
MGFLVEGWTRAGHRLGNGVGEWVSSSRAGRGMDEGWTSLKEWSWGMVLGNDFRVKAADGAGWAAEGMELGNGFY